MITSTTAQWTLSAVFVLTGTRAVYMIIASPSFQDRRGYTAHALMAAAMFTMVWPWGNDPLLLALQLVVFSLAFISFVHQFLRSRARPADAQQASGHHASAGQLAYHATMMAGMMIMAVVMLASMDGTSMTGPSSSAMGSMTGMEMSGMPDGGSIAGRAVPIWALVLSDVCALGFAVATLYFIGSTLAGVLAKEKSTRAGRFRVLDAAWNLLMAGGMVALFYPMTSLA